MQQTGYDASATSDPAVARSILLDGLRRTAISVHPFPTPPDALGGADREDLILVDLGPEHRCADLLGLLSATDTRATGGVPRGKE